MRGVCFEDVKTYGWDFREEGVNSMRTSIAFSHLKLSCGDVFAPLFSLDE